MPAPTARGLLAGAGEYHGFADAAVVLDRLRRAAAVVPPGSPLAVRLRARLAAESDRESGGQAAVLAALAEARRLGDPVALAEALHLAVQCLQGPDDGPKRHRLVHDLAAEAPRTGRDGDRVLALVWRTADLVLDGDPAARRSLAGLTAAVAGDGHGVGSHVAQAMEVMFTIRDGRFDDAEQDAKECAAAGELTGRATAPAWYAAQLFTIRWYQGRLPELLALLEEAAALPSLHPADYSSHAALALACAAAGDDRRARGLLAGLVAGGLDRLPRAAGWLVTLCVVVETAHLLGDRDTAYTAYRLLRPYARHAAVLGPGITCLGSVEHALGVAMLTTGDTGTAAEHLRRAVTADEVLGHGPAAALARERLAAAAAPPAPPEPGRVDGATGAAQAGCRREGRGWRVSAGHRSVLVEHCRGLAHLAVLLANPGRPIRAADLATGPADARAVVVGEPQAAQPLLDAEAIRRYRQRLATLRRELDDLAAAGDGVRAERARAEHDWLAGQLRSAGGPHGRARAFADAEERARVAVGKAVRRALHRIADADPQLGRALRGTVQTGRRCVYLPPVHQPRDDEPAHGRHDR